MASSSVNLLDLPTELLALIAGFLPAIDRIALFHTCTRLQDVCCAKRVVKHLDYSDRCYGLFGSSLKRFLSGRQLCDNVRVLNLNHCYWLQSDALLACIRRLKNLEELHLLECRVSIAQLIKLLGGLKHLVALSFSANDSAVLRQHFDAWKTLAEGNLSGLNSLRVVYKLLLSNEDCNLLVLHEALKYAAACRNLESLGLYVLGNVGELFYSAHDYQTIFEIPQQTLPLSLKAISIDLAHSTSVRLNICFLRIVRKFISIDMSADQHWHKLCITCGNVPEGLVSHDELSHLGIGMGRMDWTPAQLSSCFCINLCNLYGKFPISPELLDAIANFCPRLTKVSLKHSVLVENNTEADVLTSFIGLCENCNGITELHIEGLIFDESCDHHAIIDLFDPLYNLKDLRRLSVHADMLFTPIRLSTASNQDSTTIITLKERIGINTVITEHQMAQCKTWMLAKKSPLVEHLQIEDNNNELGWELTEIDLACISKWKNLRHLSLSYHRRVQHGHFLCTILRECTDLVTLKLFGLGSKSNSMYLGPLVDGFKLAQHLKDLSISQDNLILSVHFLEGLSHCATLERLYIYKLCNLDDHLIVSIVATLRKFPKLIFVYFRIDGTAKACKQLERQINGLQPGRPPAFLCFIEREEKPRKPLLNCPAHHRSMFDPQLE